MLSSLLQIRNAPLLTSVGIDLLVTDISGAPVPAVEIGDDFLLHVSVEDLRVPAEGVFAAYLDVFYNNSISSITGFISFGADFQNGQSEDTSGRGLIDEVGAFDGFSPLGPGSFELFSVPFRADALETLIIETNAADLLLGHATLLSGNNDSVPVDEIHFGSATVEIVSQLSDPTGPI